MAKDSRISSVPLGKATFLDSPRHVPFLHHYDYGFGADLFAGREVRIVDCGDVAMKPGDFAGNAAATTTAVKAILDRVARVRGSMA